MSSGVSAPGSVLDQAPPPSRHFSSWSPLQSVTVIQGASYSALDVPHGDKKSSTGFKLGKRSLSALLVWAMPRTGPRDRGHHLPGQRRSSHLWGRLSLSLHTAQKEGQWKFWPGKEPHRSPREKGHWHRSHFTSAQAAFWKGKCTCHKLKSLLPLFYDLRKLLAPKLLWESFLSALSQQM